MRAPEENPLVVGVYGARKRSGVFALTGPLEAGYMLNLAVFLAGRAGDRVRRCPHTGSCRNFFLKYGKKTYCSVRCTRRVYMRRYEPQ